MFDARQHGPRHRQGARAGEQASDERWELISSFRKALVQFRQGPRGEAGATWKWEVIFRCLAWSRGSS